MCSTIVCYTYIPHTFMKTILLSALATSAFWATVAFSLLHWQVYFLVSAQDMHGLVEHFERVYNAGYQAFLALQECRKGI